VADGGFGGGSDRQWTGWEPGSPHDALPLPPMVPGQSAGGAGPQAWGSQPVQAPVQPQVQHAFDNGMPVAQPIPQAPMMPGAYPQGGYPQQGAYPQGPVAQPAPPVPVAQPGPGFSQGPAGPPQGGAFPVAELFDGRMPDGRPLIERTALDPREIPVLMAYLTQAPVVLTAPGFGPDQMIPSHPAAVPRAYHSDGFWIWAAEVGYYLYRYQLPPHAAFLAHIRARNYQLGPVPQQVRTATATQLMAQLNAPRPAAVAPTRLQVPVPVNVSMPPQPPPTLLLPPPAPAPGQGAGYPAPSLPVLPEPVPGAAAPTEALPFPVETDANAGSAPTVRIPAWADSSGRPAPKVVVVGAFSTRLREVGNRNAAWVAEQNDAFDAFAPPHTWSADPTGQLSTGAVRAEGLGTLSAQGLWTWAWADPEAWPTDSTLPAQAARLRAAGEREQIEELTAPVLDLSGVAEVGDAAAAVRMLAFVAAGLLGARGVRGVDRPLDGSTSCYVVCDQDVPEARPSLGAVAKYLFEGAARFGGDAVECAIGYAEHYGWTWNRTAAGVEVTAEGIGRFDVTAPGGRLTGLSLHG
jgi:hypothetical protein